MIFINILAMFYHVNSDLHWLLTFHINHDSYLLRLEAIFAETNTIIFDLILHDGAFSPPKIVYKRFTRYGNDINWCLYPD